MLLTARCHPWAAGEPSEQPGADPRRVAMMPPRSGHPWQCPNFANGETEARSHRCRAAPGSAPPCACRAGEGRGERWGCKRLNPQTCCRGLGAAFHPEFGYSGDFLLPEQGAEKKGPEPTQNCRRDAQGARQALPARGCQRQGLARGTGGFGRVSLASACGRESNDFWKEQSA